MKIDKSFSVLCSWGMLSNAKLSPMDIKVYLYMKFRWQFFDSLGKPFNESVETIAKATGVNEKSIRRSIKNLQVEGYLFVEKRAGETSAYITSDECKKR